MWITDNVTFDKDKDEYGNRHIRYQCSDFQLVELGAANSTFFSCSVGHSFLQIDLFTNIKAFMDSIDM